MMKVDSQEQVQEPTVDHAPVFSVPGNDSRGGICPD